VTLYAPDRDLDAWLTCLRPLLPSDLDRHLEAVHLREDSVEIDARHVPVFGEVRANVGAVVEPGAVRVDVRKVSAKFLFGWKPISLDVIERLPWIGPRLRALERTPWPVPVRGIELRDGGAMVELESA